MWIVLTVLYIALLVHIKRGTDNRWLIIVNMLLLLHIVVLYGYPIIYLYVDNLVADQWLLGILYSISDVAFCMSHVMLALRYRTISNRAPEIIDGSEP